MDYLQCSLHYRIAWIQMFSWRIIFSSVCHIHTVFNQTGRRLKWSDLFQRLHYNLIIFTKILCFFRFIHRYLHKNSFRKNMGKIVNCLIFIVFLILFFIFVTIMILPDISGKWWFYKNTNKQMMKQMNFSPDNTFPKE